MTAMISRRYTFSEQVYDATIEEHERAMGLSMIHVIEADPITLTIVVWQFDNVEIARQWVAGEESLDDCTASFYIVGADV